MVGTHDGAAQIGKRLSKAFDRGKELKASSYEPGDGGAKLLSRFRSSHHFAASSFANFGIEEVRIANSRRE